MDEFLNRLMKVCFSGAIWLMFGVINVLTKPLTAIAPGTDIVFLPAGIRLVIIIVAGIWGAIGIAIANPVFFYLQLGLHHPFEALVNTLIAAFVPFLIVAGMQKITHIDDVLDDFKWSQLMTLMIALSFFPPLLSSLSYVAFNYYDSGSLWSNLPGMMFGDFSGCFIIVVLTKMIMRLEKGFIM